MAVSAWFRDVGGNQWKWWTRLCFPDGSSRLAPWWHGHAPAWVCACDKKVVRVVCSHSQTRRQTQTCWTLLAGAKSNWRPFVAMPLRQTALRKVWCTAPHVWLVCVPEAAGRYSADGWWLLCAPHSPFATHCLPLDWQHIVSSLLCCAALCCVVL